MVYFQFITQVKLKHKFKYFKGKYNLKKAIYSETKNEKKNLMQKGTKKGKKRIKCGKGN